MLRLVWIVALAACGFVDTLDGHIDDLDNCCAAATTERVRACVARLHERTPGEAYCAIAYCDPPISDVETFVDEHGEVHASCPATW